MQLVFRSTANRLIAFVWFFALALASQSCGSNNSGSQFITLNSHNGPVSMAAVYAQVYLFNASTGAYSEAMKGLCPELRSAKETWLSRGNRMELFSYGEQREGTAVDGESGTFVTDINGQAVRISATDGTSGPTDLPCIRALQVEQEPFELLVLPWLDG